MKNLFCRLYNWLPSKTALFVLVLLWLLMQVYLYNTYGVKLVPDSLRRYLPLSEALIAGNWQILDYNSRYLGYLFFLSIFLKAGLSFKSMVLVQTLVSGVAAIYLYKLAFRLSGRKTAAFIAAFLFIGWPDVQYFNYFILTESLFTSFLIFSYYAVLTVRPTIKSVVFTLLVIGYTCMLRPNGFLVLFGSFMYLACLSWPYLKHRKVALLPGLILFGWAAYVFLNLWLHKSFNLMAEYRQGEIIYGAPRYAQPQLIPLDLPATALPPFSKILYFIWHNPVPFFKLAGLKLLYFLAYIKPYHSAIHVATTLLVIYPMYFFSGVTLTLRQVAWPAKIFGVAVFAGQCTIVALTVEDWDNRFSIPFLPYVFLLGSTGLTFVLDTYLKRNQINNQP